MVTPASPTATPSGTPIASPAWVPSAGPISSQGPVATPQNVPQAGAPASGPSNTPSDAIGTSPTSSPSDANATSADAKVLGPAIAIPIAAAAAGVFLLVFFLRKKKKKADKKKDNDALDGDASMSVINPAADPGRYSAIVSTAKDDGLNPTAIQPSEIDKRMQIPYKSLRFIKEIGAGSYGKVFVG